MTAHARRNRGTSGRQTALLVLGSLLVTALVAEGLLRLLMREEEVNGNYWGRGAFEAFPEAGYRHAEGFEGFAFRRGVFETPVKIGRFGLRQSDLDEQLAYDDRLLILGDSYTFGLGVAEEATFPHLLEETLNPLGIGVINGGQSGYAAQQEAAFGIWLSRRLRPSLIVLCLFPNNDLFDDYRRGYERVEVRFGYRLSKHEWPARWVPEYLRTHSYLWLFVDGRLNRRRSRAAWRRFRAEFREDPDSVARPTLQAIRKLVRYSSERGLAFGVVLIGPPGATSRFSEPVISVLRDDGVPLMDLECRFGPGDRFAGDGHWNELGHRKAALLISGFVKGLISSRSQ